MARQGDAIHLRGKTWWLDFRHRGQRHQVRLGSNINKSVAKELAVTVRAAILKGEAGIQRKRKDITFDKAAELFLKWVKANRRPKTHRSYEENIHQLKKEFGGRKLSYISPFLLEKYKIKRRDEGAPVRANRELACLSSMVNRLIEWNKYEGENPVSKVKKFKESAGRTRTLDHDEEELLLAAASEPCRTIILMGIYTGLRVKSEVLTLTKSDINLRRGYLEVQAAYAKNGEKRTVPLAKKLVEPLKAQMKRSESEWVFVKKDRVTPLRDIETAFNGACRRAKLTDVNPHALRHTFATRLVTGGADLRTVQLLGGWSKLDMVERYTNPTEQHKVDAVERIGRKNFTTLFTTPQTGESSELPQVVENE